MGWPAEFCNYSNEKKRHVIETKASCSDVVEVKESCYLEGNIASVAATENRFNVRQHESRKKHLFYQHGVMIAAEKNYLNGTYGI